MILKSEMSQGLWEAKVEKVSCKLPNKCLLSHTEHDNFISATKTFIYIIYFQDNSLSRLR